MGPKREKQKGRQKQVEKEKLTVIGLEMEQRKHAEIGPETAQGKQAEMEKAISQVTHAEIEQVIAQVKHAEIEQVMLQRREMEQGKSAMSEHVTVTVARQLQEDPLRGLMKQTADCAAEEA
jgi:hypothetical protein